MQKINLNFKRLNLKRINFGYHNNLLMEPTNCNTKLDIAALYFDEIPNEIGSGFNNHLEEVKLLILADRILPPKRNIFEAKYVTQRFQNLYEIVSSNCEEPNVEIESTTITNSIRNNQIIDTQFEISETQLLRTCEEAENNESQNNNSLLHAIFNDFSSVESSTSIVKTDESIDETINTFSDPNISNKTETIANDLESLYDSDSVLSDDSETYRHINFSHKANPVRNKINIINSVAIRENISNLSKHFSQHSDKNTYSDNTLVKEYDSQYFPKIDNIANDKYHGSQICTVSNALNAGKNDSYLKTEVENYKVQNNNSLVRFAESSPNPDKKIDSISDTTGYQFQENNTLSENNKAISLNLSQNTQNKVETYAYDVESLYDSDSILSDDSDTYRQIDLAPHNIAPVRNQTHILNSAAIRENISRLSKYFLQQLDKNAGYVAETENKENVCNRRKNSNDNIDFEESTMEPSQLSRKENFKFILNRNASDEDFHGFEDFEVYIFKNFDIFKDSSTFKRFVLNRNASDEDFHGFEESEVYIFRRNHKFKETNNTFTGSNAIKTPISNNNNLDKQKTDSYDGDDVKCDLKQNGFETLPISLIEKVSPTTSSLSKDNFSLQSLLLDCHDWDDTDFDPVCSQVESLEPSKEIELFDIEDVDWNEEFTYKSQSSSQIKKTGIGKKDCDNLNPAYNKTAISSKMALLKEFKGHMNQVLEIPKENGFKTASNKTMAISEKARLKAQQFIQDFNNSQTMSCKISDPKEPALDPLKNVKKTEIIIAHGPSFTTASKKPISISEAAIEIANRLVIEVDADSSTLEMSKTVIRKRKCVEMSNDPPHTNFKKISKLSSLGVKTNTSPRTPLSSIDNGSPLKSNIPIFKLASTPLSHKHFADRRPSVLLRRNALSQFKNSYRAPIYSKSVLTPSPSFNENLKFASSVSMNHPHNINGHSFIITQDVTGFQKMPIDQSSEIRINNRDEDKN